MGRPLGHGSPTTRYQLTAPTARSRGSSTTATRWSCSESSWLPRRDAAESA